MAEDAQHIELLFVRDFCNLTAIEANVLNNLPLVFNDEEATRIRISYSIQLYTHMSHNQFEVFMATIEQYVEPPLFLLSAALICVPPLYTAALRGCFSEYTRGNSAKKLLFRSRSAGNHVYAFALRFFTRRT